MQRLPALRGNQIMPRRHLAVSEQDQLEEVVPPWAIDTHKALLVQEEDGIAVQSELGGDISKGRAVRAELLASPSRGASRWL